MINVYAWWGFRLLRPIEIEIENVSTVKTWFLKLLRIYQLSRCTSWNFLDRDHVETNWDPRPINMHKTHGFKSQHKFDFRFHARARVSSVPTLQLPAGRRRRQPVHPDRLAHLHRGQRKASRFVEQKNPLLNNCFKVGGFYSDSVLWVLYLIQFQFLLVGLSVFVVITFKVKYFFWFKLTLTSWKGIFYASTKWKQSFSQFQFLTFKRFL